MTLESDTTHTGGHSCPAHPVVLNGASTVIRVTSAFTIYIFFPISVNFQNSSGTTVTVTLAVTVKTFSLENVAKMK